MDSTGIVFDIQHLSLGDGPGIRTTVFLKGCPLKCEWCHNPESQFSTPQMFLHSDKCIECGCCIEACTNGCHKYREGKHLFSLKNCNMCKKCVNACKNKAIEVIGKEMSVSEVIDSVEEDYLFYRNSGGGLTLSGGEPMFQSFFSASIAREAKQKKIHTCIETSGFCETEKIREIARYIDLFLFDYKANNEKHKKLIGVDNSKIIENLFVLDSMGKSIVLRCPIVPGKNLDKDYVNGIIDIAKKLKNIVEINLLPYHNAGLEKRIGIGMSEKNECAEVPSAEVMNELMNKIYAETKIKTVIM